MHPFTWPARVYYENTDAGGVVYHAEYLKFMERARTEWLRHLGHQQATLSSERGLLFAVVNMEIDFLASARLDDLLNVSVILTETRRVSLLLAQTITRMDGRPEPTPLIRAKVRIAMLSRDFKPVRIPQDLLNRMPIPHHGTPEGSATVRG
ncbi:Acyl-CoA thioesterase YbgC [Candidatus Magnetaquicoccaceae bacterium FCR-1]|uniref:Acyl-CoA thioesterase YbgC n=1 Tax=Candidatus Magnetaquiglobus chichijimensis TaxID=3141448 RepID=A0ABQ0CBJ2_9PROT